VTKALDLQVQELDPRSTQGQRHDINDNVTEKAYCNLVYLAQHQFTQLITLNLANLSCWSKSIS